MIFNVASFQELQKTLPYLAAQILQDGKVLDSQITLYRNMSNQFWWEKNVVPVYIFSKADGKEPVSPNNAIYGTYPNILSLKVTAVGDSEGDSIRNAIDAIQFIKTGGAYTKLKSLVDRYEGEVIINTPQTQKRITSIEIELGYQEERLKRLLELSNDHSIVDKGGYALIDANEGVAKYLPIGVQIIAAKNEINDSKETLRQLNRRLAQLIFQKKFVENALEFTEKTANGLLLGQYLLELENNMRNKISKVEMENRLFLDDVREQIYQVQLLYDSSLRPGIRPVAKKTGLAIAVFSGAMGMLILATLVLLRNNNDHPDK